MSNHVHLLTVPETETGLAREIGLTNMLFIDQMELSLNQRLRPGTPGRPRKTGKCLNA